MAGQSPKSSDRERRKRTLTYTALGAGCIILGGAAYLWYKHSQGQPGGDGGYQPEAGDAPASTVPMPYVPPAPALPSPPPGFPISRGSRGPLVVALQKLLNTRFKAGLATDGQWGRKTDAALVKAGLPTTLDANAYAALVGGSQPQPTASEIVANWAGSPLELAEKAASGIAYMVNAADAPGAMTFVHAMRNVSDYVAVNTAFKVKKTRNAGGTMARRTLVNALLGDDMPWTASEKGGFANEFLRMGLKHNPATDKWTLSGIGQGHLPVRVATPTIIWDALGRQAKVPAGLRIGVAVSSGNGITQVFTHGGETIFVPTHALSQVNL